jgi:uncharacterized protein (TIGR02996 family)
MGRYRLGDKIWSIQRHDTTIVMVEPDGTERTEELADLAATSMRFTILTRQKLNAGWKLVRETEPAATGPVTTSNVFDARNLELERQLIADPDSRETWLVYGDWLQQQGDPRGEVIASTPPRCSAPTNEASLMSSSRHSNVTAVTSKAWPPSPGEISNFVGASSTASRSTATRRAIISELH